MRHTVLWSKFESGTTFELVLQGKQICLKLLCPRWAMSAPLEFYSTLNSKEFDNLAAQLRDLLGGRTDFMQATFSDTPRGAKYFDVQILITRPNDTSFKLTFLVDHEEELHVTLSCELEEMKALQEALKKPFMVYS